MTEEEKEAIETMKRWIEYEKQNKDKINKANELIEIQETVLNLIQKQDKEIEHWKNGFERELENNRKNTCELLKQDLIIREKDKQIDLMAEKIHFLGSEYDDFCIDTVWNEDCDKDCKNCIKQYFERKVKDGRD